MVRIVQSRYRWIVIGFGISGGSLLLLLLALPYLLMVSLKPEDARKRVHHYLRWRVSQRYIAMLKERGMSIPDVDMAIRWKEEIDLVNKLEFVSIEVRRPLSDLLDEYTPNFVVRAVLLDKKQQEETHYFWLNCAGIDQEISRLAWIFTF